MEIETVSAATPEVMPEGFGGYTVAVISIAVFCIAASVYLLLDEDTFGWWTGVFIGVCGLGMSCFGWALASVWWFRTKGVHPWWSLIKPRVRS